MSRFLITYSNEEQDGSDPRSDLRHIADAFDRARADQALAADQRAYAESVWANGLAMWQSAGGAPTDLMGNDPFVKGVVVNTPGKNGNYFIAFCRTLAATYGDITLAGLANDMDVGGLRDNWTG